jgi:hypothetical protein
VLGAAKAIFAEHAMLCAAREGERERERERERQGAGKIEGNEGDAGASAGAGGGLSPASDADVLGADDLVPIFIFVLCQSGLQTPLLDNELLWQLCHPDQLYGEAGYFLTVYESAVAFVEALHEEE